MGRFDNEKGASYSGHSAYSRELLMEKDKLIELQEKDMISLKREMESLKKQLNCSKQKKKS